MNDTTNNPVRRRKPSGARKAIVAAVVVAVAGGGWYGWKQYKTGKAEEGAYFTAPIGRGDIEDLVTSTGKLQPRDYVDVGAQVSGQIEKIYVEVGDVVEKGDVLARIDATTAAAKVDQMRAQLLQAQTNLEDSRNSLEKAERDAKRQAALLAADATTKESKLNADTQLISAQNRIKTQTASIDVQAAALKIEERNLAFTEIRAPISGTVMSIKVKEGQTVNASQNVPNVLQIADLNTMTVQSEVSEADISKLYNGIQVYFTTLNSNRRWYGELKRIEPTPKEQNSVVLYNALFDVQNEMQNGSTALRPQMTAQVYFVSAEARDVLMVPMSAITQGQQITRELRDKERAKGGESAAAAGGPGGGFPGGPPGAAGAPGAQGAAPAAAAGAAAATTTPGAAREGAATVAANTAAPAAAGSAPAAGAQGAGNANRPGGQGNRQFNAQNGAGGAQSARGQGGGNFNGPRPGGSGAPGGAGAAGGPGGARGQGGFNPQMMQNMTQEEREQMMARFRGQGGGGGMQGGNFNGQRPGGANGQRGNFGGQRSMGGAQNAAAAGPRPAQRRNATVAVMKADGTLDMRRIVYGVTNRVQAEVLEGLKEGEEVVIGKKETEAAAAARPNNNNNNNNNNFQNNRGNNFQGGGNFQGGRPF